MPDILPTVQDAFSGKDPLSTSSSSLYNFINVWRKPKSERLNVFLELLQLISKRGNWQTKDTLTQMLICVCGLPP